MVILNLIENYTIGTNHVQHWKSTHLYVFNVGVGQSQKHRRELVPCGVFVSRLISRIVIMKDVGIAALDSGLR